jgi:multiple antibiotic resistance protein
MDAIGNIPFLLSFMEDATASERIKTVNIALLTATVVGFLFLLIGKVILAALGIEVADFAIAGGVILLVLSINHLVTGRLVEAPAKEEMVAVVPIGTPLLAGPAAVTTLLLLVNQYSSEHSMAYAIGLVSLSFVLNLIIAWVAFAQANRIARFLGQGGLKAMSKIASLLLAAIAVKMIRLGIMEIWVT